MLKAEYRYTTIDGFDLFETEIHSVTLKNYFNMNRLYRQHRISEYVNPFLTFGLGRDFFTYESATENISNDEFHFNGGFGLAFNFTETIELFGQYELQFSSNSLDNIREGFPSDLIGMASGGIRLHLGGGDKRRMSMAPRRIHLNEAEYDDFKTRGERVIQLEQQLMRSQDKISSLESDLQERNRDYEVRVGPQSRIADAQDLQLHLLEEYEKAFLVTFPRPANLRDEYIDIQIVN